MHFLRSKSEDQESERGNLLGLAVLALWIGVLAGLLGAAFRFMLVQAEALRGVLVTAAHAWGPVGFIFVVVTPAILVAFAVWLVQHFAPRASGSGIPDVEAALVDRVDPPPFWRLIPVKFVGGVLAIGSGLALGREGPSVQMGASAAHFMAQISKRQWPDARALIAAGAGAGLATAFNAPLAGAIFVLEELYKRFETRIAIAALAASVTAIMVLRTVLGDAMSYHVSPLPAPPNGVGPLFIALGLLAGLLAVAYNAMLLGALALSDRFGDVPVVWRAGLIGAVVGGLAWFAPGLVGGGDPITQSVLSGAGTLTLLPLLFAIRLVLSTASYAAGTPGGLFAPMLVLGAQSGLFFGLAADAMLPDWGVQPESFAVVGMAALFTGIVRAPLTGIILTLEMTGSVTLTLPMLAACFAAMVVPTMLGSAPIYDSLKKRTLERLSAKRIRADAPEP